MGRPRTPTRILKLSGAFKKNPSRERKNEPIPTGEIGKPPKHFNVHKKAKELKAAWREIIKLTPEGVLTNADRIHLEIMCQLLVEFRSNPAEFTAAKITRLEAMFAKVGLNPCDRSKVIVPGKPKNNSFDDL